MTESLFILTLWRTARVHRRLCTTLLLVSVLSAIIHSRLFPTFVSTASLRVVFPLARGAQGGSLEARELCAAGQRTALRSRKVLAAALAKFSSTGDVSEEAVRELDRSFRIERLPFEEQLTLRMQRPDPSEARILLASVVSAYLESLADLEHAPPAAPEDPAAGLDCGRLETQIVAEPSTSRLENGLGRNVAYGIFGGVYTNLLLLCALAMRRGRSSEAEAPR